MNFSSPNFNERPENTPVDTLVFHYTNMPTAEMALTRLCDPASRVSAHYLIEEGGKIHALVPEDKRAWHAGRSFWRGRKGLNDRSIGIELANPGHSHGYRDFPPEQIRATISLSREIMARHPVVAPNIVGHSDIAPERKQDPGERFPWKDLADAGIGLWPETEGVPCGDVETALTRIGYDPHVPKAALLAFTRHFLPGTVTDTPTPAVRRRLSAVLELLPAPRVS